MKIRYQFLKAVPLVLVFACFGTVTSEQMLSEQDLPTLSPALHAALYPEVMCAGCIVPHWDRGYLLHVEFDRDPAVVTMYDRVGKKVLEGRMAPPDAVKASVGATGATRAGRDCGDRRRDHDRWFQPKIHRQERPYWAGGAIGEDSGLLSKAGLRGDGQYCVGPRI